MRALVSDCLAAPAASRGDAWPKKRVFLLGDSHALNLVPSLAAAVHGDAELRMLTAAGRGFFSPGRDADYDSFQSGLCGGKDLAGSTAAYREAALGALDESVVAGDVVVIHNSWLGDESDAQEAAFYEKELVDKILAPRKAYLLVFSDWTRFACDSRGHKCATGKWGAEYKTADAVPNRAQLCFEQHKWFQCASFAKPWEQRQQAFQQLAERKPNAVKFLDLYGLFVDHESGLTSINIPGTNLIWQGLEVYKAYAKKQPEQKAVDTSSGFNSHTSLVGSFYFWPYLCDLLASLE